MAPQGSQRLPDGPCERCRRSPVWPSHRGSARLRSGRLVRGHSRAFVRRVRRILRRPDQKRPFFSGFLHVVRVLPGELFGFLRAQPTQPLTPGRERSPAGRFAFMASSCKDLRRSAPRRCALRFQRDPPGSESNHGGCSRTPKSLAKTLGISD